jgi:hypothetical protein
VAPRRCTRSRRTTCRKHADRTCDQHRGDGLVSGQFCSGELRLEPVQRARGVGESMACDDARVDCGVPAAAGNPAPCPWSSGCIMAMQTPEGDFAAQTVTAWGRLGLRQEMQMQGIQKCIRTATRRTSAPNHALKHPKPARAPRPSTSAPCYARTSSALPLMFLATVTMLFAAFNTCRAAKRNDWKVALFADPVTGRYCWRRAVRPWSRPRECDSSGCAICVSKC